MSLHSSINQRWRLITANLRSEDDVRRALPELEGLIREASALPNKSVQDDYLINALRWQAKLLREGLEGADEDRLKTIRAQADRLLRKSYGAAG